MLPPPLTLARPQDKLYICEFCLKYMTKSATICKHRNECPCRTPPGLEIYRENNVSVFEIDGTSEPVYCQNLCLLAKLFLDHKTLYYDVDPFLFYVIAEIDDAGECLLCSRRRLSSGPEVHAIGVCVCAPPPNIRFARAGSHIVGYFSKEKQSAEGYNLACILTFPQFQRSGYGKFIISLSYEISKREGSAGSPEKPLSDLGKLSYRSYWTHVLFTAFATWDTKKEMSIESISEHTAIRTEDIISTLQHVDMIREWKSQHVIVADQTKVKEYLKKHNKPVRLCKQEFLKWQPPEESK